MPLDKEGRQLFDW